MNATSSTRNKEHLKQSVIDLAIQEFRSTGIKGVTMDDIAHKMGMSKRTLYQIFTDKEDLLMACVEKTRCEEEEMMQIVIGQADNVLEVILYGLGMRMSALKYIKQSYFQEMQKYPKVIARFREARMHSRDVAVAFLEKGKSEGLFRDDVDFGIVYDALALLVEETYRAAEFKDCEPIKVFENTVTISLRGCATTRGVEIIDEFLNTHSLHNVNGIV